MPARQLEMSTQQMGKLLYNDKCQLKKPGKQFEFIVDVLSELEASHSFTTKAFPKTEKAFIV
jgi:hypothetical protein